MKFDEVDIYEFFDNEMHKSKFSDFFKALSEDRNLMFEFMIQKRLRDVFAYRQEIHENTDELDREVMIGLGLNPDPWKLTWYQKIINFFKFGK